SIRYFWGDSTSAAATDNPRDRVLFRVVNGGANEPISAGLTDFKIKYYSALGTQTTNPDSIRTLEVNLAMESDIMYDTQYPKLFWHGKITPPGLVTR
ncbi:MAG: hypothetical protein ONA90_10425, partial [candidate division KSB1 bacterium]|nr:hypothetical protein [candidate division KSB1 bacterium]